MNAKEPRSRDILEENQPITNAIHTPGTDYDSFNSIEEKFEDDPRAFEDGYGMVPRIRIINNYT